MRMSQVHDGGGDPYGEGPAIGVTVMEYEQVQFGRPCRAVGDDSRIPIAPWYGITVQKRVDLEVLPGLDEDLPEGHPQERGRRAGLLIQVPEGPGIPAVCQLEKIRPDMPR